MKDGDEMILSVTDRKQVLIEHFLRGCFKMRVIFCMASYKKRLVK